MCIVEVLDSIAVRFLYALGGDELALTRSEMEYQKAKCDNEPDDSELPLVTSDRRI